MRPPGYDDERHAMADDRRLRELQWELRAVGLGALVLLGFLCSISFRSRFAGISDVQRGMYVTSVVLTALAAALLLVPAAYVRLASGHRPAEQVTRAVHGMAAGGLAAAGPCGGRGGAAGGQVGRIRSGGRSSRRGYGSAVRCCLVYLALAAERPFSQCR
jgi:uncharacterized low-complexity protein